MTLGRAGRFTTLIVAGVITLLCVTAPVNSVAAASPKPVRPRPIGGVSVSPAFQQIVIEKTDTEKTFDFAITNNSSEPYEFAVSAVDFGSLDETGGVLFMGEGDKSLNYKYGLSQYITLQQDRVVAEPKATVKIPVTISNKESLTPGGHYGAILVTPTTASDYPTKVEVNQVISSLLFITKRGGEKYNLGLQSFELKTHLFSVPSSVEMRFQNAGNVHIIPRGMITVTDPRGRMVQRGFINEGSAILLPETFRKLSVPLKSINKSWWPGIYHMQMTYRFDGEQVDHVKDLSFTYVNGWYVVSVMAILALAVLAIVLKPVRRILAKIGRILAWPFMNLFNRIWRRKNPV